MCDALHMVCVLVSAQVLQTQTLFTPPSLPLSVRVSPDGAADMSTGQQERLQYNWSWAGLHSTACVCVCVLLLLLLHMVSSLANSDTPRDEGVAAVHNGLTAGL